METPSALHGDGINFAFFNMLWSKNSSEIDQFAQRKSMGDQHKRKNEENTQTPRAPILRLPDTVIFLFGQPHQWYFTSKNGGPDRRTTTILRKRRANLTLENIEEVFLNKASSRGEIGENDVVAYFINSKNEESDVNNDHSPSKSLDVYDDEPIKDISCNIEYFNKNTLRDFLHHGKSNKCGILQRFISPHGGGHHNSQIRATWTPKLCVLERRKTKQDLHDMRFAICERAVTFDGPDVHSVSVPLRGTVLAGKVEKICDEIVRHITKISTQSSTKSNHLTLQRITGDNPAVGVGRMVVNFKVDGNGIIWILWSNSIRLYRVSSNGQIQNLMKDINPVLEMHSSQPLNMNSVVSIPSSIMLSQVPSHNLKAKLENILELSTCPSCNKRGYTKTFQQVTYKTIIHHFEKTIEMLRSHRESDPAVVWPPKGRFIRAAGSIGFGNLFDQVNQDSKRNNEKSEETFVIPPVIRHIHPDLRVRGYRMYRDDSLFLNKTCDVCEDCFLAYAKLTSSSFLLVYPVDSYGLADKAFQYDFPSQNKGNDRPSNHSVLSETAQNYDKNKCFRTKIDNFDFKDLGRTPEIPPAILEPPEASIRIYGSYRN